MASQRAAPRSRTVVPIALASLIVEIAAWWWIGTLTSGVPAAFAVSLGMIGLVLAVVVIWQLWRINRIGILELQRAKTAAARAVEHERATEQA